MLANLVSWRYSSLFVLVITLEELRGQSTLNGVSNNYCGSESRIKSDPSSSQSETLDRIELQIRVLEENLYQATVDSKARSDQTEKEILNLRSEIQFLRSRSCICSSVTNQPDEPQTTMANDADLACPASELANTVEFPPNCCSFPFTIHGQLHHRCTSGADGYLGCLIEGRTWVKCAEPIDYVARNQSINLTIPFVAPFTAIHVNNWIVWQQRIDQSLSFNRSWIEYKIGFGKHDGNFWMGLEKIHKLTNNSSYKLRIEFMMRNGSWYSAEYDTFRVESESRNYRIHVGGYSGDLCDVMNIDDEGGTKVSNGMSFSTYDLDNDLSAGFNCASAWAGGWWYQDCYRFNANGAYQDYFSVSYNRDWRYLSTSRMMIKMK